MRSLALFLFTLPLAAATAWAEGDYHYTSGFNGKQFTMAEVPGKIQVSLRSGVDAQELKSTLHALGVRIEREASWVAPYLLLDAGDRPATTLQHVAALPGVAKAMPLLRDQEGFLKTFAPSQLSAQFKKGVSKARQLAVIEELGASVAREQRTPGYYTLSAPADRSLFQAIRDFNAHEEVWFAELSAFSFEDRLFVPNDTRYDEQWPLHNVGQSGGTPGADIHAEEAWDLEQGDGDVIVSVIDTGIDWDHPDLASKVVPIGSEDWDFSNGPNKIPHDSGSHGTATNGIAGAATSNSTGMAGVAPNCGLMPLKVDLTSGANQNRADAINYVVTRKNDFTQIVISCSWRMSSGDFTGVEAACQNARDNGILLCFSSGNDNGAVNYPAKYSTTICVGATSQCDERKNPSSCDSEYWWGSNYGNEMDIAAPGVDVLTTYPGGGYTTGFNGTSAACPHAAGALALIWSAGPSLSATEAQAVLESTADDEVGIPGEDTPGWDRYMGWGRINLYEAVLAAGIGGPCDLTVALSNYPSEAEPGTSLTFDAAADNDCDETLAFDQALMVIDGPASLTKTLYAGPDIPVAAGSSIGTTVALDVPLGAPTGTYTVTVELYLDGAFIDDASFQTVVSEPGSCPDLTGTWDVTYIWSGVVTKWFYADGTWDDSEGYDGTWIQDRCEVDWWYTSGTHYWGTMEEDGQTMAGEMLSYLGRPGTWTGLRLAD